MKATGRKVLLATGALVASSALGAGAAQAEPRAPEQVLTFDKGATMIDGKLIFEAPGVRAQWRAGSGHGENWSNDCARAEGHLPDGTYQTTWHQNHDGEVINGRAVHLDNKLCSAGTVTRTELFIHSEQTVDNTQGNTEGSRWDGDEDYKSEGCVKMHPNHIAELFWHSGTNPGQQDAILNVVP